MVRARRTPPARSRKLKEMQEQMRRRTPKTPHLAPVLVQVLQTLPPTCPNGRVLLRNGLMRLQIKRNRHTGELISSLLDLVKEQDKIRDLKVEVADLSDEDIDAVNESIPDTSGKYIKFIGHYQVEVEKEEEDINRKRLTEKKKDSPVQTALDEYYAAAKDLCHSQAVYMDKSRRTG